MIDKIKAELIAKAYYESVYKYCVALLKNNSEDAGDIAQDVFLLFQEKCDKLEDKNIKSWLLKTASLKVKEYYRALNKDTERLSSEDVDIEDESVDICTLLEDTDTFDSDNLEKYRNIIFKKLTEKEQKLYNMHYVEKKPHKQIAEELNTNTKNVSVMISRLNKKLNLLENLVLCTVGQLVLKLFF